MVQSLRLQIAEAQIAVRQLKADLAEAVASTEAGTIKAAGGIKGLPGTEDERKKALALAVTDSPICRKLQRDILMAEAACTRLEARQQDQQDQAQRERWQVRARLCDALEALGMAQPAGFFSGAEVERSAEHVFDTMVSATAKRGMEDRAEVLYNTGRHVVAVRGLDEAVNAEVTPRGRAGAAPAVARYRAENEKRSTLYVDYPRGQTRTEAEQEADELFGD